MLLRVTFAGFNYPHQIAVWYAMYRVARNHPHLKVEHEWQWYLARAANTTIRLGFARIGYMDGTVTREVLRSVLEEAEEAKGAEAAKTAEVAGRAPGVGRAAGRGGAASLWAALGEQILEGEKGRADYFTTAPNPYGSEFAYDTTGQEEVVVWLLYFDEDAAAARTVDHVLQYMRSIPNWAYHGGASAGDVANGGKWFVSAGTGRGDYGKMHYRAGLNQIPLVEWYRRHPDDLELLEIAMGAVAGQLGSIDASGAPSIYFHAYPHVLEHDAYSGDYGLGFFGSSLEAMATLVLHPALGPLCYLCDLAPPPPPPPAAATTDAATKAVPDVAIGAATKVGLADAASPLTLHPRDAYRQRVYLELLGTYLQADCGMIASVTLDMRAHRITVRFAPAASTPAGTLTYERLRLRVDKIARPEAKRPGDNFTVIAPTEGVGHARAAFEIPAKAEAITVIVQYDD